MEMIEMKKDKEEEKTWKDFKRERERKETRRCVEMQIRNLSGAYGFGFVFHLTKSYQP